MAEQFRSGSFYLAVGPGKYNGLRAAIYSRLPRLEPNEIMLELALKLPAALFEKPQLKASVQLPEGQYQRPVIDAQVIDNIRAVVSQQLGVDLTIALIEPEKGE